LFNKVYLKNLCLIALNEAAKRYDVIIEEVDVQPEHLHMVAHIPLKINPLKALQLMKGFSSKLLFEIKPKLRLLYPKGSLWSRGKFAASIGDVDIKYVLDYVRNQETHHAKKLIISINGNPRLRNASGASRPKGETLVRGGRQLFWFLKL
jgi:putative transposase